MKTPIIHNVTRLNVAGGSFVQIAYAGGEASVLAPDADATNASALLAAADAEAAKAAEYLKRAALYRAAAFHSVGMAPDAF